MSIDVSHVLVGDIGGTHARFAIVKPSADARWTIGTRVDLDAASYTSFEAALRAYLERAGLATIPKAAAIAVAGPVTEGHVTFTNRSWQASEADLKRLGIARPLLINDFGALAYGAMHLQSGDLSTIGPELDGLGDEPISILGAGTGFGVSCLARYRGRAVPMPTEGGHAGFAPDGAREVAVLQSLSHRFGRVSIERVLSGPGLENLHAALEEISGRPPMTMAAADIVARAEAGVGDCRAALDMFCGIFGAVAGDFALAHGARGGVYLAGGIAQKIAGYLARSAFRARFEDKGRLSGFVKPIPTRLIVTEDVAFLGAARACLEFIAGTPTQD